jgi:hypothetical protein
MREKPHISWRRARFLRDRAVAMVNRNCSSVKMSERGRARECSRPGFRILYVIRVEADEDDESEYHHLDIYADYAGEHQKVFNISWRTTVGGRVFGPAEYLASIEIETFRHGLWEEWLFLS